MIPVIRSITKPGVLAASLLCLALAGLDARADHADGAYAILPAEMVVVPHDDGFHGVRQPWNRGAEMTVIFDVREIRGRVAVCGGYFVEGPLPLIIEQKYLQASWITVGGRTVMSNLHFFTRLDPHQSIASVRMSCSVTGTAWNPAYGREPEHHVRGGGVFEF